MTIVHDVRNEKSTHPDEAHEIYFGKHHEKIVFALSEDVFKIEDERSMEEVVIEIADADMLINAINKMKGLIDNA